jgi:1,4-dihydroxy-2-naphthoate octaprenyltransferase
MNVLGMIHPITLFTLISLPMAIRNIKLMMKATTETLELIKDLDGMTAQLVMVFSMLFSILNVIAYFL